jgi:twinfilin-like protein
VRGHPHPSTEWKPHPVALATESLVPVASVSVSGTLDDDLALLQDHLEENVPCYVLTRLDNPPSEWLIISYVPDAAQVRQKVIAGLD